MNQKSPARPPRPRRRRSWRLTIVPLLLLLAACSSSGGTSTQPASGSASGATSSAPASTAPGPHLYIPTGRYVALGDSFSSGEGSQPYQPGTNIASVLGTPDLCHRSNAAYPEILQKTDPQHAAPIPDDADFVACSARSSLVLTT